MSEIDLTAAQKAALDIDRRRCCVTASAGTGKTFVLTHRYIELLKRGVEAGNILCLTFTEKAAAEMREKIEREVKKVLENSADLSSAERLNLENALNEIHRCTISTFHGFCSSVLKEFPLESETPLGYAVMDSLAGQELTANAIEDTLEHPDKSLRAYAVCLYSAFSAQEVPKLISGFLHKLQICPEWFRKLESEKGWKEIYNEWEALCNEWKNLNEKRFLDEVHSFCCNADFQSFIDIIAGHYDNFSSGVQELVPAFTELASADTRDEMFAAVHKLCSIETNYKKGSKLIDSTVKEEFMKARENLKKRLSDVEFVLYDFDDPHTQLMLSVMQALYKITSSVAEKVEAKKTAAGYLNFDDLITSAESLLKDEKICAVLAKRYKYVLVDEVQDNDSSLTGIIRRLAGKKDDSLFIVGDMKQSIYRFRGADPECVQNELFTTFPEDGRVTLDTNFRTVQRLIDAVNILFTRLYPEGNAERIPYEAVKAHRNCCPESAGTLTLLRNEGKDVEEADLLARWIGKKVEEGREDAEEGGLRIEDSNGRWRPAEYRDFAVLVRKNSDGNRMKKAFDRLGIPYHDCSGDKMYSSDEIRDLLSVIRAAVYHEDDKALYAALKSPYFGITDAELAYAAYDKNEYPPNLWRRLTSFAAGEKYPARGNEEGDGSFRFASDTKKHLTAALSVLEFFARTAVRKRLPHLIRLIIETTGIISVYAALPDGTDRISNLRQFLAVADHISAERGVSVYEFLRIIETCVENKIDNDYSSYGETSAENRVQIMTYHVSKGLEFPVVALYRAGKRYNDMIKGLMADNGYGAGYSLLKYPGEDTPLFLFLQNMIIEKERPVGLCEEKRLFYVGMTRARDHLAVSVTKDGEEESYMEFFSAGGKELDSISEVVSSVEWSPDISAPEVSFADNWHDALSADDMSRSISLACISSELMETKEERARRFDEERKHLQEAKRKRENISRGLCIHEIFEGKNPEEICRKYGCEGEQKRFERAFEHFKESEYLKNVETLVHELPLTTAEGEGRRTDLFVRYKDGSYAIFDYKSSASASPDSGMRDAYSAQLTEYSDILSAVYKTKEKIPAYLYFAGDETFVEVVGKGR